MKIIVATHNLNKVKEFKEILQDTNIELVSLHDLNDFEEIVEDGESFLENALIKAKTIYLKYNMPVIADDSGIEIEALNNAPGIHSARYSEDGDLGNNLKVLARLKDITNRNARFKSVLVLFKGKDNYYSFEGIWEGTIADKLSGDEGFGYDPIFIPKGYTQTAASLGMEIKNKESHRAKALKKFREFIK